MKKLISFLLVLSLFVSCAFTGTAEPAEEIPAAEEAPHTIEIKTYPFYYNSTTPFFAQPKIALVDGVADIPYMDIRDCMKFVHGLVMLSNAGLYGSLKMSAEVDEEKQTVLITRENGESMFCDFGEGVIVWSDFYAFFMNIHGYYMDQVLLAPSEGLLRRTRARERYGELTILNLREYDIPMIAQDGLYLLPLQTLSAFFVNPFTHQNLFFNQEAVFLTQGGALRNPLETLYSRLKKAGLVTPELREKAEKETSGDAEYVAWVTQELLQTEEGKKIQEEVRQEYDDSLYKLYAGSSPKGPRSEELCRFGFNELLLELDMLYGLKEAHDIDRFVLFLAQTGLSADLLDPDPAVADWAMYILTDY